MKKDRFIANKSALQMHLYNKLIEFGVISVSGVKDLISGLYSTQTSTIYTHLKLLRNSPHVVMGKINGTKVFIYDRGKK